MSQKIILFPQNTNSKWQNFFRRKVTMLFVVMIVGAILGLASWHYFIENVANLDVKIPQSQNITFNDATPIAMTTAQIANEFEKYDGKPVLLYIYATWCKVCTKNFPALNEVAREFQNTDLQVLTIAIDRNMSEQELKDYFAQFGDIYFQPRFLAFKDGFKEFLQKRNIRYENYVPFTVLISREGEVIKKFSGAKGKNYLRNQVIKGIYLD